MVNIFPTAHAGIANAAGLTALSAEGAYAWAETEIRDSDELEEMN